MDKKPFQRFIGAKVNRLEDDKFIRGNGRYIADITLPGTLHAAFLRSPHAHALIKKINTDKAKKIPGVIGVWTGDDIKDKSDPLIWKMPIEEMQLSVQPLIPYDKVKFVGEAVAVVVATNRYIAEDAVEEIEVEYEPLPVISDAYKSMEPDSIKVQDQLENNIILTNKAVKGDVDTSFKEAALVMTKKFRQNRYMASPMETRGCLASYSISEDFLTIWSSTQAPYWFRSLLSNTLKFPEHKIRMVAPDVGGGFGQKLTLYPEEVVSCILSIELQQPVKWIEDRRENLLAANHAKEQDIELSMAFNETGRILAMKGRMVGDSGAYTATPFTMLSEVMNSGVVLTGTYDVQNIESEFFAVLTNKSPVNCYRGIGWTAMYNVRESMMEEAARKLGIDPIEIRKLNMVQPHQFPYLSATNVLFDSGSYVESMNRLRELVNYDEFRKYQSELRQQGKFIGIGFCPYNEPSGVGTEMARSVGFPISTHDSAIVSMDPSGKVTVTVGAASQGQGHETTLAQVTADQLGVPLKDIRIVAGDSATGAYGMGTFASRTAVVYGGAIIKAAKVVREKVLTIAAFILKVHQEELDIYNGSIYLKEVDEPKLSLAEVAFSAYFIPEHRPKDMDSLLESKQTYDPPSTVSNGAHAAIVEVDIKTGMVKVTDYFAIEDCGTVINPIIVEGQLAGAIAQGIGGSLLEHLVYDEQGQLLTASFMDYLIPTATDVPNIVIEHMETPSPTTINGIKGVGESGMISAPSTILNAVQDALSPFDVCFKQFPLNPENVLEHISKGKRKKEEVAQ
ncbi:xanthine dehydrogenase family protein molybdopterin-binding subunit [Neobacillus niacini]|uniref:xanthine dehydrogenase family protein molybdopterin-binding subunit n=1 Tax=Neobacillus niacini TaxID=86668 RepID=UPI0030016D93